jgi:hypothetical protein
MKGSIKGGPRGPKPSILARKSPTLIKIIFPTYVYIYYPVLFYTTGD